MPRSAYDTTGVHQPYSKTPDPAFFGPWCHGVPQDAQATHKTRTQKEAWWRPPSFHTEKASLSETPQDVKQGHPQPDKQ